MTQLHRSHRHRWIAALVAASVTLGLTACGSSGGSDAETKPSGGDTGDAAKESTATESGAEAGDCEKVDKVRVVLQWVTQSQFAGYYAAKDKGIYEKYCLDVTIQEGGVNVVPQQVLGAGNAEFAVSHVVKSMASREEGSDITLVSQVFQRGGYYQVAWADSGITTLSDLRGKTIGSWGFGNELVLYSALRANDIEPEVDVNVVQQPFDMSLLLSREIDAAQAKSYNEYAQLLEATNPDTGELYQPEDFSVIDLNAEGYAQLEDGIYARESWLVDNGDIATRFIAASGEGWIYCRDEFDACVDVVLDNGSTLGRGHMTWMLNEINKLIWPSENGFGSLDQSIWDASIQLAIDGKVLAGPPTDGAYDMQYNDAALKILNGEGLDTVGANYEPRDVTVTPGGE